MAQGKLEKGLLHCGKEFGFFFKVQWEAIFNSTHSFKNISFLRRFREIVNT